MHKFLFWTCFFTEKHCHKKIHIVNATKIFAIAIFLNEHQVMVTHTSDHFYTHAKIKSSSNCFCTIMARRIEKREQANKLPWSSWTVFSSLRYFLNSKNFHCYIKIYSDILMRWWRIHRTYKPDGRLQENEVHVLQTCQ